jgi:Type I phosphodiesterase / nucleotide pyrophosphatase
MKRSIIALSLACAVAVAGPARAADTPHNALLFVADGLRPGMVNEQMTAAIPGLWKQGVRFVNTHSMFPTFTTANASAMATGQKLGDTGDFSNIIDAGFQVPAPAKVSPHSWRATLFSAMSTSTTRAII